MRELKDLVPSLELCKLIPEGEFNDSALVWEESHYCEYFNEYTKESNSKIESYLSERSEAIKHSNCSSAGVILYPAPTAEEIINDLPKDYKNGEFYVEYAYGEYDIGYEQHSYCKSIMSKLDKRLVNGAIKLWLELKGIKVK